MVGLLWVTGGSVLPRLPSHDNCRFLQALLGVEERTLRNSRYGRRRRARARIRARGVWPITYDLSIGRMTVQRYGGASVTFDSPAEGYGMRSRVRRTTTRSARLGRGPRIACINKAHTDLGVDFTKLVRVLQAFVDECLVPVWRTPARLVPARRELPGARTLVVLPDADPAWRLGYHEALTNRRPLARVLARSSQKTEGPGAGQLPPCRHQ